MQGMDEMAFQDHPPGDLLDPVDPFLLAAVR
jgi:hypothetical protein